MRGSLVTVLVLTAMMAGCSNSGNGSKANPSVALVPPSGLSLSQGANLNISAHVGNDATGAGVAWTLTGDGALLNPTPFAVTYVAPSTSIGNSIAVVTATSLANSGAQSYVPITLLPPNVLDNVQPISVDGGPVRGEINPNAAFTSITVCAPGTTTCRSIDGILVDTGSTGLRVLASALPDLPSVNSGGNPLSECVQFPDQSYLWGNVVAADVRIAGEVARSLPIHSIGTQNGASVPPDCSQNGAGINAGTQVALGANGILGVGYDSQDCGAACDPSAGGTPPASAYYSCSAGSCDQTFVAIALQVTNPVVTFLKDNNGLVLQFPGLDGVSSKLDGTITFGIGTQVNNQLGSATVFTIDSSHNFTTNLSSTAQSLTASGVNSGSSALFFPDDSLPQCGTAKRYFCPASSTPLASLQVGVNGSARTVNFVVENAEDLFNNNPGAAAFSTLAGPNGTGGCAGGMGACRFEWGLPFFYGRTVFTAISGQTVPEGVPPSPWFAYTTGFTKK